MEEERKLGAPEEKAASPAADGAQGIPLPAGTDRPEAPAACDAPEAMPAASETQPEAGAAQAETPAACDAPEANPAASEAQPEAGPRRRKRPQRAMRRKQCLRQVKHSRKQAPRRRKRPQRIRAGSESRGECRDRAGGNARSGRRVEANSASGGMPQTPPANGPAASCGTPPPPPGPYPFQAGQPHPWQQPGFGPGAFGYGALPPRPKRPRRRLTLGVRVFLSVLAVIAIFSLGGVCASAIDRSLTGMDDYAADPWAGGGEDLFPFDLPDDQQPEEEPPEQQDGMQDLEIPDAEFSTSSIEIQPVPSGDPLTGVEIYERVADSVVSVNASYDGSTGYGSGIIVSEDGFIITNSHVIFDSRDSVVSVKLHNGEQYGAVVIGYERNADLAVLRIDAENLQAAEFGDSSALRVGEQVFAIGSPGGERYSNTLTGGYVSGLNRELDKTVANGLTYIQTDAAVNPGNSGGALVNAWGQVVGINSNKVVSASYEALGFAIPISDAASMLNDLLHYGYVTGRSRLGVTAQTVTQMQAELSGVPVGVLLVSIEDDSPLSGVANVGDIITEADGQEITSLEDLYGVLRRHSGGDQITVTLYSPGTDSEQGGERQVTITLLADNGETQN